MYKAALPNDTNDAISHALYRLSFFLILGERRVVAPAGQGLISATTLSPVATHGLFACCFAMAMTSDKSLRNSASNLERS